MAAPFGRRSRRRVSTQPHPGSTRPGVAPGRAACCLDVAAAARAWRSVRRRRAGDTPSASKRYPCRRDGVCRTMERWLGFDVPTLALIPCAVLVAALAWAHYETVIASLLLASPYLVLATGATRIHVRTLLALHGVLLLGTAFGVYASGTSSTGGLVFLWLVPLQLVVATLPHILAATAAHPERGRRSR
jgi:hypothetical protein